MVDVIKISKRLVNIFNNVGITLIISDDMNYLDIDENDSSYITYITTDKLKEVENENGDPWKEKRNRIKIGRFIKKMFFVDDKIIETISNQYKSHYYLETDQIEKIFEIVDGEDIRYWYNEKNYVPGGGTLNSSCMRGDGQQERLDLYVENPEIVKLLIMKSGNKLLARALMWQTDQGVYIDRAYCRFDKDHWLYIKYAEKNNFKHYNMTTKPRMNVMLKKNTHNRPYLDTFRNNANKVIHN
jgi:hypothetical protein